MESNKKSSTYTHTNRIHPTDGRDANTVIIKWLKKYIYLSKFIQYKGQSYYNKS